MVVSSGLEDYHSVDWAQPINWRHPLARGLLAWWRNVPHAQGNTTWRDITGRYPATLTSMATPPTATSGPGRTRRRGGWAQMNCDGTNDYATAGDIARMDSQPALSVAVWAQITDVTVDSQTLVGKYDTGGAEGLFLQTLGGSDLGFGFRGGSYLTTNTNILAGLNGVWVHVATTFDASTSTDRHNIYVNGRLAAVTLSGSPNEIADTGASTTSLDIGRNNALGRYLTGAVDDVMVYTRSLRRGEIDLLYQQSRLFHPQLLRRIAPTARAPAAGQAARSMHQYRLRRVR